MQKDRIAGQVIIANKAFDSSYILDLSFVPGRKQATDRTFLWLSNQLFYDIIVFTAGYIQLN
jgi:hypothetical protein